MELLLNNTEHRRIITTLFNVLSRRGERVTTGRLAQWVFDWFPQYRERGIKVLEREVTEILYN